MLAVIVAVAVGAVCGMGMAVGSMRRWRPWLHFPSVVALVIAVVLLIPTAWGGLTLVGSLLIAYIASGAVIWRDHPSLDGMSFVRRGAVVLAHGRRLQREDAAIHAED
ncbi:hypothetical protein [Cryobacterium sp. CG_9.6]|uniref:hypothetical protein n=1 Tax=Cryobacterium sp. CG_9.6 TaxID=2760710 RepID=UPI002475BEF4|nr:hypothetical protein [Cryobacterium sp. CG_9.6]MDH6235315.1 hypothetical protein [Cryobacterium sp. CG_9.6]